MRTLRLLALGVLMSAFGASVVHAAQPHHRGGFFIGFNLGAGTADISSDEFEDTDREWGGAGNFRLGGAIKQDLLIGFESTAWVKDEDGTTISLTTAMLGVTYYPGNAGLFLRGGVGLGSSSLEVELPNGFTQSKDENGIGLAAAVGYEWRLTRKFAMGPQVDFTYLNIGDDIVDTANFFDITLGFNWYW
jgi:hypothetical protein